MKFLCGTKVVLEFCFVPLLILFMQRYVDADQVKKIEGFLEQHCITCHNSSDQSGDRDFEELSLFQTDVETQLLLQEIIDQITLGAMPPEDMEQPTDDARVSMIRALTACLQSMREQTTSTGGRTVLRRLSHREYRNTVSDLLGISMNTFDPTKAFPHESLSHGFDNIGDQLVTSGFLLDQYLAAADVSVERAFLTGPYPEPQTWKFDSNFKQQQELDRAHQKAFDQKYLVLYDHPFNDKPEGAYGALNAFPQGVPIDGLYKVRVLASALHRKTPYSKKAIKLDLSEPFRMGIRPGSARVGPLYKAQPLQPKLAEHVLADDVDRWYECVIPLDRGYSPRFTFENGQHDIRGAYSRIFKFHQDTFPESLRHKKGIVEQRIACLRDGFMPQIRIQKVEIYGPLKNSPQIKNTERLVGGSTFRKEEVLYRIDQFATQAFRRPVSSGEIKEFYALFQSQSQAGRTPYEAYKDTLKAILCSPKFLYFNSEEQEAGNKKREKKISQHALAERLSYFLTSSMPDAQLQQVADEGRLNSRHALRAEVIRLLGSEVSKKFTHDFLESWLNLRELGSMPPDFETFPEYYASNLQSEMKEETRLFFRHVLNNNLPARELLSANYSFLNRDLAKLYGVENQTSFSEAAEFQRVQFTDKNRGGLLGQGSVLTVTANGIETSPVIRGVWMLEHVLGTPTPPPPDDVPAIDPDIRGATTVKAQLEKHRSSAACNECHRKIDPLGFAMECFDPIGRTRTTYDVRGKRKIDTAGVLPSGESFSNLAELKTILVRHEEFFVRTLVTHLLTHALGRHIEPEDRFAIDKIMLSVKDDGYRLRDLVVAIITSDLFARQ